MNNIPTSDEVAKLQIDKILRQWQGFARKKQV
jgi:hypothetical protein